MHQIPAFSNHSRDLVRIISYYQARMDAFLHESVRLAFDKVTIPIYTQQGKKIGRTFDAALCFEQLTYLCVA
jgi:ADP-glucose pyrophosphorylase